eukprot:Skav208389  [mRNA]  locus=scaffold3508:218260:225878:+ [translate_table: standard]
MPAGKDFQEALESAQRASARLGQPLDDALALAQLGNFGEALQFLEEKLRKFRAEKDKRGEGRVLFILAQLLQIDSAMGTLAKWCYISANGRKRLPQYVYSGSDNSLMYIYFCSPLADFLVKFVPRWLAPNVITFSGLALSLAGYCLVYAHAPTFGQPCPSWVWLVLAACTFAYQTLDNMDGKQARRTNSSSALGLFIDHGVDALNIVLTSQNAMALLQLGNRETAWACLAVWTSTATPFFFATWEEHFTGSLYLGPFNGPTDGVLIVCISYVITALASDPTDLWNAQFAFGMSRAEAMIAFYAICVLFTVLGNICSVLKELGRRHHKHPETSLMSAVVAALSLTLPFCLHLLMGYFVIGTGSLNLRMSFWFLGFSFLILVSQLQLSNVCSETYKPWRWILLVAMSFVLDLLVQMQPQLLFGAALLGFTWLHLVIAVTIEMADILQVPIFAAKGSTDEALQRLALSAPALLESRDRRGEALAWQLSAKIHLEKNDLTKALAAAEMSAAAFRKVGDRRGRAQIAAVLAETQFSLCGVEKVNDGNLQEARRAAQESVSLFHDLNERSVLGKLSSAETKEMGYSLHCPLDSSSCGIPPNVDAKTSTALSHGMVVQASLKEYQEASSNKLSHPPPPPCGV